MTRRLAAMVAAAAITFGTSAAAASIPFTPQPTPAPQQSRYVAAAQPPAAQFAPVPREFTPLGLDSGAHAAFPAATRLPDGRVVLMWRESDGHLDLDGGKIMRTVGDPTTGVWTTPTEVVVDGGETGATPHTGPSGLSYIDGKLWLTYFFWHDGKPSGARVTYSLDEGATWSPSVRVDGGRPWAAVGAPVVKWQNQLVVPWYGRNTGESIDTVWLAFSSDGGATWTTNRYVNAIGAQKHTNEPWALVKGSKMIVLYRDGSWSNIAIKETSADGTTWLAPRVVATNSTANSGSVWASNGVIYVIVRHTQTRDAMLLTSRDSGATWTVDPVPLLRAPANLGSGSLGMTYGAPVDLGNGLVWCPVGLEQSLDVSRIYTGWL